MSLSINEGRIIGVLDADPTFIKDKVQALRVKCTYFDRDAREEKYGRPFTVFVPPYKGEAHNLTFMKEGSPVSLRVEIRPHTTSEHSATIWATHKPELAFVGLRESRPAAAVPAEVGAGVDDEPPF